MVRSDKLMFTDKILTMKNTKLSNEDSEILEKLEVLYNNQFGAKYYKLKFTSKLSEDLWLDEETVTVYIKAIEDAFNVDFSSFNKKKYRFDSDISILPIRNFFSNIFSKKNFIDTRYSLTIKDLIISIKKGKWIDPSQMECVK